MSEPKKKKSKSLSTRLKEMRADREDWIERHRNIWNRLNDAEKELNLLRLIAPIKYYKIKYKIKNNADRMIEVEEVYPGFFYKDALKNLKINKTHPDSVELISFECLGS